MLEGGFAKTGRTSIFGNLNLKKMTAEQLFFKNFSLLTDEQKAAVLMVMEAFLGKSPNKPGSKKKRAGYGSLKGTLKMSADFDEPLEDMKEYMY